MTAVLTHVFGIPLPPYLIEITSSTRLTGQNRQKETGNMSLPEGSDAAE